MRETVPWHPEDELSYYLERPEEYSLSKQELAWADAVMAFQKSERRAALEMWDADGD